MASDRAGGASRRAQRREARAAQRRRLAARARQEAAERASLDRADDVAEASSPWREAAIALPGQRQPLWLSRRRGRRRVAASVSAALLAAVLVVVATVVAAPPLAPTWRWGLLAALSAAAVAAAAAAAWLAVAARRYGAGLRLVVGVAAAALLVSAAAVVGASTQVVIDGQPHPRWSEAAQVRAAAEQAHDDLRWMVATGDLLYLDRGDARVRAHEYEPASIAMREMAQDYAALERDGGPTGEVVELFATMKRAATVGASALEARRDLVDAESPQLEEDVAAATAQFADEALAAGQQLDSLASRYGFRLGPTERTDPVE